MTTRINPDQPGANSASEVKKTLLSDKYRFESSADRREHEIQTLGRQSLFSLIASTAALPTKLWNPTLKSLVVLALLTGCARSNPEVGDLAGTNPYGVSETDYETGAEREQSAIRECMENAGWPYEPEDPDDLIISPSEQGPAWGIIEALIRAHDESHDSMQPRDGRMPDSVRIQDQPAWTQQVIRCSDSAFEESQRRRQEVSQEFERLDRAWAAFKSSDEYSAASEAWKQCMRAAGYDVETPDRVSGPIEEDLLAIVRSPGFEPASVDRAEVLALQHREIALFDADQKCRSDTIAPVEASFKRQLLTEQAGAAEAIRKAIRND